MNAQALLDAIGAYDPAVMDMRGKDAMIRAMTIAVSAILAEVYDLAYSANEELSSFELCREQHFPAICTRVRASVARFNLIHLPTIGEETLVGSESVLAVVHELLTEPRPHA